jgi:hypothetical protein
MMRRLKLATAIGPVRTPAIPEVGMRPRWCQALRVGRSLVGFLCVMTDKETLDDRSRAALAACVTKAETLRSASPAAGDRDTTVRYQAGPEPYRETKH